MKLTVLLVVMPVIVAGCFGGGNGHAASPATSPVAQSPPPSATASLSISYQVGINITTKAGLAPCPGGAVCHDVQLAGGWVRVAVRSLTCPLVSGDVHPTAACAALEDLMRLRKSRHLGLCSCAPVTEYPQARAVGRYKGHRVSIPLDVCSLCGVGRFARAAHRDAALLMPQR